MINRACTLDIATKITKKVLGSCVIGLFLSSLIQDKRIMTMIRKRKRKQKQRQRHTKTLDGLLLRRIVRQPASNRIGSGAIRAHFYSQRLVVVFVFVLIAFRFKVILLHLELVRGCCRCCIFTIMDYPHRHRRCNKLMNQISLSSSSTSSFVVFDDMDCSFELQH